MRGFDCIFLSTTIFHLGRIGGFRRFSGLLGVYNLVLKRLGFARGSLRRLLTGLINRARILAVR